MSDRGSFVTEYVYCPECFAAARLILLRRDSSVCSCVVPSWDVSPADLPIIAGKIGLDGALWAFDIAYRDALAQVLCHPLRIAILAETGECVLLVMPQVRP